MTQLESKIFDFVESVFGTEAAIKNFCFWSNNAAILIWLGYVSTLPIKYVKIFWQKLKEKGVI
jgi:hypothetical protein